MNRCCGPRQLWPRSLFWLAFLGPFFFVVYGLANNYAAHQPDVGSVVFDWERRYMPFVPMLMLPYMSIDAFYALSLFVVTSAEELHRHAKRLLTATLVSVSCFFAHPLKFAFTRPPVDGFNGHLLEMLTQFDKPFNQAPSLHISLLILLWAHFANHTAGWKRWALHVWFVLIGLSVPLTWQHHLFDVIAGAFVGFAVWYALPEPQFKLRWDATAIHPKLTSLYAGSSLGCATVAVACGGLAWLLLWPAVALLLVSLAYGGFGTRVFQKESNGSHTLPARMLLLPYLVVAHFSRYLQTRHARTNGEVGGLALVCWPGPAAPESAVLDLCAELGRAHEFASYRHVAMLDLVAPTKASLDEAMAAICVLSLQGKPVYVHCALGRGRSAIVAAAWLLHTTPSLTVDDAVATVRTACPRAVVHSSGIARLKEWKIGR